MPKSREQLIAENHRLRENFKKDFGGHHIGNLIAETLSELLSDKQRKFVMTALNSYSSQELAEALEVEAEISEGKIIHYSEEDPAAHLEEEPWVPKKILGGKVSKKMRGKAKGG